MFLNSFIFNLRELVVKSPARRDKLIIIPLVLSSLIILIELAAVPLVFRTFKDYIILHYNIYFGISSLGHWSKLFFIPLLGLLIVAVNYFLAFYYFYLKDKFLGYFLALTALVYNLITLAALFLIIYINS